MCWPCSASVFSSGPPLQDERRQWRLRRFEDSQSEGGGLALLAGAARREAFRTGARQNALFLGKWLVLAFVLESLMVAYVPGDLIAGIAGDGGFLSILAATLLASRATSMATLRCRWSPG